MKEWELKQKSIQRWENEGGALLPTESNLQRWQDQPRRPEAHYADHRAAGRDMNGHSNK